MSWGRCFTVLAVAAAMLGAAAPTTFAQTCTPGTGDRCVLPGQVVACDASGDQNTTFGSMQDDIERVSIAEPPTGPGPSPNLVVTLKVAALNVDSLPLNHVWRVLWVNPTDAMTYFVSMLTCDATQSPSFDYGFIDANGIQASQGSSTGSYASNGTIQITISKSLVGNPSAAQVLGSVVGNTRVMLGAQCTGSLQVIDDSETGSYTLIGTCPNPPPLTGPSPCKLPGVVALEDPSGDLDVPPVPDSRFDIRSVSIAEPFGVPIGGGNVLIFTVKVADLATLPPNAFWRVTFTGPGGMQYVRMINCAVGGVTFDYGHFTTGSVSDGPADAGTYSADGTIRITLAKSKLLGGIPSPGSALGSINADARESVGNCPGGPAAFPPVDVTVNGDYTMVGNAYCTPHTVSCPAGFNRTPSQPDTTINFVVNNLSTAFRTFSLTVADPQGWLVGGPFTNVNLTVPPTSSGSFPVTVHVVGPCNPAVDDVLTFTANASDLPAPDNIRTCQTTVTCPTSVGIGDGGPDMFAFGLIGSNPFRRHTVISYTLPERSPVRIDVYNVAGQRVRTLVNRTEERGTHSVAFDLRNGRGKGLGAGVYLVRITTTTGESRSMRVIGLE
jgi:flagellar hook capping protein FlgD